MVNVEGKTEMNSTQIAVVCFLIWNIIVFCLYGIDKSKAKRGKWRISENTLIISAALMGGLGALFGMIVFRHKTKHLKFKMGVPVAVLLNIAVVSAAVYWKVI